ncbi:MAG TPA: Holliday junction resolvase RuvX [Candidatus Paceibacterota bacterium]|nr:Holliday junction resolvase RuvX [Candidatus Paceibacterota bacterium]
MKYLGIDYGEKRIGLAASDDGGQFAFAREVIPNDEKAIGMIAARFIEEDADRVVIGIPAIASGGANPVESRIRAFAEALEAHINAPVIFENEQWSSREATRFAPGGVKSDAVSAAIILQRYLDAHPPSA